MISTKISFEVKYCSSYIFIYSWHLHGLVVYFSRNTTRRDFLKREWGNDGRDVEVLGWQGGREIRQVSKCVKMVVMGLEVVRKEW